MEARSAARVLDGARGAPVQWPSSAFLQRRAATATSSAGRSEQAVFDPSRPAESHASDRQRRQRHFSPFTFSVRVALVGATLPHRDGVGGSRQARRPIAFLRRWISPSGHGHHASLAPAVRPSGTFARSVGASAYVRLESRAEAAVWTAISLVHALLRIAATGKPSKVNYENCYQTVRVRRRRDAISRAIPPRIYARRTQAQRSRVESSARHPGEPHSFRFPSTAIGGSRRREEECHLSRKTALHLHDHVRSSPFDCLWGWRCYYAVYRRNTNRQSGVYV